MAVPGSNRGQQAEAQAAAWLSAQGLSILERNYRCRYGELDLIARDGDALVFIEVRFRRDQRFGGAAASVDVHKQARILYCAQLYLQQQWRGPMPVVRFDVIAMAAGPGGRPSIEWIRDAFGAG